MNLKSLPITGPKIKGSITGGERLGGAGFSGDFKAYLEDLMKHTARSEVSPEMPTSEL